MPHDCDTRYGRVSTLSQDLTPRYTRSAAGGIDPLQIFTGQPLGVPLTGHIGTVTSVAFSPNGHRLASASTDQSVRLWNADTGQPVGAPLTGHTYTVNSVAFSPDAHRLASASSDETIRVWAAALRAIGAPLQGHDGAVLSVAFSPDGSRLASASTDQSVRLWNADTGQRLGAPLTGHTSYVHSVAFSPTGHEIASASNDGTIRLWDGQTQRLWDGQTDQPLASPLTGHTAEVLSVAFSPDGGRLASGSADMTQRRWPAGAQPEELCAKLTANMSREQWDEWVSPRIDYTTLCPNLPTP